MRSKNSKALSTAERIHLERVKSVMCAVCDAAAPSEAHHIEQGDHYTTVALCTDCHRGPVNGLHGQRVMWRIHKTNETRALGVTFRRVLALVEQEAA